MNTQLVFDRLDYVTKLEASGFDARQARGAADALGAALTEAVATKNDLRDAVSELKSEIKDVRSEMKLGFAQVDAKVEKLMHDQIYKIVALTGSLLGISTVILHFWK